VATADTAVASGQELCRGFLLGLEKSPPIAAAGRLQTVAY